ncbi:hypothetical protein A1704_15230 [Chryseobacterium cucumeris]|uniref:restriction endonuclease subunit S n=1 Tax=Chryseobacterium cucumeris TaxID=1813611 RepID=UPI0007886921|nr:restriction endonuclease subunit S [Chryseobacterium cucumeris]KYH04719.1 hypothetical protein A1704_15230 [Chryseobacterium cucumeris]
MMKNKKQKLVPELRFPEFKNAGEWKMKTVNDLCNAFRGSTFSKADLNENGKIYCIHYGELFTKYNEVITRVYSKTNKNDGFKSKIGDILMPSSDVTPNGLAKASAITFDDVILGGDMNILRPKINLNSIFLSYLLNHSKSEVIKLVSGTTVKHIYPSQILTCKIPIIDNTSEQKKIASCLSSLDEVITAHSQKLELLKDHKIGLMQNLFPQQGNTVPNFRFPEFKNDGDWVEKTIETIKSVLTDYVANGSFQSLRENLNVVDSEDYAFYVRLTDLRAGLGHPNQKYVDENTYNFLNKSALYGGELLMANIGANVGEVWQMPYCNKPSTLAPNMLMIKFKKEYDSGFVFQFLTSNHGINNISKAISGSGHPKISKTDLKQVKITLPQRIEEQQKIASCLSALDTLIDSEILRIEQLKQHKRGLMQGLFPEIEN